MTDTSGKRLVAIDILRGLIIILMALDHTRDFWGFAGFSPTDLSQTYPALFFTRWLTHFCAPLFIFLTGVSAFLYGQQVQSKSKLRNFLLSRGLWLVIVELVIINPSWQFGYNMVFVQVIWVIGISMIIMAGLIYLPTRWILLLCMPFVLFHNLLDDSAVSSLLGDSSWLWMIIHQRGGFKFSEQGLFIFVAYPLIPWFAVMAGGYVMGQYYLKPAATRQTALFALGAGFIVMFILLRASNIYGDPTSWQSGGDLTSSLLSFLNTTKYPPSLQFLLMTMGPGLILLGLLDKLSSDSKIYPAFHWLKVIGSVPLFFYIVHVPLINLAAHLYTYIRYGQAINFFNPQNVPAAYSPSLLLAYIVWATLIAVLYYPCKRYGQIKRQSKNPLFSYL